MGRMEGDPHFEEEILDGDEQLDELASILVEIASRLTD